MNEQKSDGDVAQMVERSLSVRERMKSMRLSCCLLKVLKETGTIASGLTEKTEAEAVEAREIIKVEAVEARV
ncbi:hypothetical protein V6N12_044700 [Hibiscus sabdariffa]|uniref:Uncharacterized protein n=1 Tax=Hibiscus sabdariffa TaxID=183260 RepID=A0ABR2ASN8_9ROSI